MGWDVVVDILKRKLGSEIRDCKVFFVEALVLVVVMWVVVVWRGVAGYYVVAGVLTGLMVFAVYINYRDYRVFRNMYAYVCSVDVDDVNDVVKENLEEIWFFVFNEGGINRKKVYEKWG